MPTMKIGEESESYSTASFTFPNNPNIVDTPFNPNRTFVNVPYGLSHISIDGGGANPGQIAITGTFYGTSKATNYQNLSKHIYDQNIKKFFISDTLFYYFLGQNVKKTHSGSRTNFIDYVANLWAPIPFAFSDTEKSERWTISDATEHTINSSNDDGINTGAFSNSGNAPSFVKWVITNGGGGANITKIEIGDGSTLSGSSRKLTWQDGTGLAAGETLTIYVIKFVSLSGNFKTIKYGYCEKSSSEFGSRTITGRELPYVSGGETNQSFSIKLTGNNVSSTVTAYWRDSYTG